MTALSSVASLSYPLHAPAHPVASRLPHSRHAPVLSAADEAAGRGGDDGGRQIIAIMQQQHIEIKSVDSWLTTPLSSSFADSSVRTDPSVHRWLDIGVLSAGAVHQASSPTQLQGSAEGDYHPQGFIDELTEELAFTSVKISPRGVAPPGSAITAAVVVTDSRGGARIYAQSPAQPSAWIMRIGMAPYLLKGYLASHWQSLAPFDAAAPLPAHLPSIPSLAQLNRRRHLVSVEVAAWSGMVHPPLGSPFVMLALGTRAGVVSIWRIPLMLDPAAAVAPADAHPQLLCSVTPAGDAHVLISQLAFSPLYFDATRHAQVCSLAIGTSAGRVHLYGLLAAATVPMTIQPLTSHRLGSKLMSISALSWSQILGGPAACSQCAWCFASECTHRPAVSSHGMSVHHTLAVGCGGHIQVITMHPDLYAQPEAANPAAASAAAASASAASAVPPAHASLCHVFTAIRAHSSTINSFVWNIQAVPTLHNVSAAGARPGVDELIPLACHHVQLLSSSNDDTVHRWVVKDRIGSRGEGALAILDSNRRVDLEKFDPEVSALAAEADPDYSSRSALLRFPTKERVHGASGLLRSADGMLLYTYDLLVAGSDLGAGRKRQFMSMLQAAPFPFVDLTDDVREECAQAALDYSSITIGEPDTNVTLDAPPVPSLIDAADAAEASQRSAMDIMQEELQEERRQEAARTPRPSRSAAAAVAAATAPPSAADAPVKMELDLGDSPDPRSLTAALATPSAKQKKAGSTPKSKQKEKKKRKKFSELGAESEEESEDEWKGGGAGGEGDDDEEGADQSSSSEAASTDDDDAVEVLKSSSSATKVKRAPRATPRGRHKKLRLGDRRFEVAENVPIPQPTQTEALFKVRLVKQLNAMWQQAVPLWRDTIQQAARARLCSVAGPVPATAVPASLSMFSLFTYFTGLLNPLHLSTPPSLSALPTKMVHDEEQAQLLALSNNPLSSRRAPDTNPETTFSLWWAMLPHILPIDAVYGGFAQIFRDESEQGEQITGADRPPLPPLYPIDAFALPIHRQLPFLFGADCLMYTAENCVAQLYPDNSALTTLWLDSLPGLLTPDFVAQRMQLRLALALLQMALSARSPFMALGLSDQPRAHSLQERLTQALHLQYLRQRMEQLTAPLKAAPDATARAQAALNLTQAQPLASVLLTADWLLHSLLSSRGWDHPNALSLLRTLLCLYSAFPLLCKAEIQWLEALKMPNEDAAAAVAASAAAPAAASASAVPSWQQTLSLVASSWRSTPREKCVLCASIVPLTSSDVATCESKHAVPRCRRTLSSITGLQCTDACGVCGGVIIRNAADSESHLCPLCIANTHPTD